MKKKIGLSLFALAILIILGSVIFENIFSGQNANIPSNSPTDGIQSPAPQSTDATNSSNEDIQVGGKEFPMELVKADHALLENTFVAPSYIDEDQIAFELIEFGVESNSHIAVIDRNENSWKIVYTAPADHVVDTLVGLDKHVFWVEHIYERQVNTAWIIKMLSLQTGEIIEIQSGVAEDEIFPPVLRADNGLITWIATQIENNIVISTAFAYDLKDQTTTVVAEAELNEQKGREGRKGTFFIMQRPFDEGLLIHQSVFSDTSVQKKEFQIVLYPYDKSEPQLMIEGVTLVDFTANSQYFVLTEEGKVSVINRASGEVVHEIHDPLRDLTYDSPFIRDGLLYYRYSTDGIYALDLQTGIEHEVVARKSIYSKLFNSEGFIGFSYMPAIEPENEVEFFILPVEKTE